MGGTRAHEIPEAALNCPLDWDCLWRDVDLKATEMRRSGFLAHGFSTEIANGFGGAGFTIFIDGIGRMAHFGMG